MIGVTFGDKHSFDDFGIYLTSKTINPPEPKTNTISVPLRDGSIDLTESLTNDVKYNDRKINMTFSVIHPMEQWSDKVSEIENYLHGKRMKVVFDDDQNFYYMGRLKVNEWSSQKSIGKLVIECTADPYKYDVQGDWLWDPFDFENDCISESENIAVSGSTSVVIVGKRKKTYPTITASAAMSVSYNGTTYNIIEGINKLYEMILDEGENTLTFNGSGSVLIEYTGGSL
jgi:predicted phage tail component-like protein|nr:MAG TPA: distal tail protein [Caudoviricetes sp.]